MVFVTGGAGFIGSHTCLELLEAGYQVVVADNLCNSKKKALDRVEEITGRKLTFIEADVCNTTALEKIFSSYDIDSVIHFAGLKAVGESVSHPLEYFTNNLNATLSLCKVMKNRRVKRLVFSSSATVYAGSMSIAGADVKGLTEDVRTGDCTNPYGWTKYMSEQIFKSVCTAYPDFSIVLLRYFNPIGAHKSGRIGEDPEGIPNNLMPYIAQVAVGRRPKLTVFGNDYNTVDGTGVRDYIHVTDLARAHIKALEYAEKHSGCEAFNIGTGKGTSVLELVKAFEKESGVRIPYEIGPRRSGDVDALFADVSKAEKILGFKAEYDIYDMCRDVWIFQKKNPNGY